MSADLGAVVGFSAEELSANRAGRLSDRQRVRLAAMRTGGRRYGMFVVALLAAFVVVIAVVLVPKLKDQQHSSGENVTIVPIVVGVLAFVVLVIGASVMRSRRRLDRLASGRVLEVSGPARTRAHRLGGNVDSDFDGGGIRYELTIGSTTFFVGEQRVLDAFASGAVYRAYYAAGGGHAVLNRLLSVEQVG